MEETLVIQAGKDRIQKEDLGDLEAVYQNYYDFHIEQLGSSEISNKRRGS